MLDGSCLSSVSEFWPIIEKVLAFCGARTVVEIGAEQGRMTARLCSWAGEDPQRSVVSIDPSPTPAWLELAHAFDCLAVRSEPSLQVLKDLPPADCYVIDGDHNYYTVYNELVLIHEGSLRFSRAHVVFLHDVSWPWARRDLYANRDLIPPEHLHKWGYLVGVDKGQLRLSEQPGAGVVGGGGLVAALDEGGPRNGVLTAIEDFLRGRDVYTFLKIDCVFGLGALLHRDLPNLAAVREALAFYADNYLLPLLEKDRTRLLLALLEREAQVRENPDGGTGRSAGFPP